MKALIALILCDWRKFISFPKSKNLPGKTEKKKKTQLVIVNGTASTSFDNVKENWLTLNHQFLENIRQNSLYVTRWSHDCLIKPVSAQIKKDERKLSKAGDMHTLNLQVSSSTVSSVGPVSLFASSTCTLRV